jgi:hypothetical protein
MPRTISRRGSVPSLTYLSAVLCSADPTLRWIKLLWAEMSGLHSQKRTFGGLRDKSAKGNSRHLRGYRERLWRPWNQIFVMKFQLWISWAHD